MAAWAPLTNNITRNVFYSERDDFGVDCRGVGGGLAGVTRETSITINYFRNYYDLWVVCNWVVGPA